MEPMTISPKIHFWLPLLLLLSSGCMGVKPGKTGGKPGTHVESFYVGDEGMQYYIKPIPLHASEKGNKTTLVSDFSFRYRPETQPMVTMNFSIFSDHPIKKLDSLHWHSNLGKITITQIALMFIEKDKEGFHQRFTLQLPLSDVIRLLQDECTITIRHQQESIPFYTRKKKTQKVIRSLHKNLFVLME
jgi:hypothetical protein